MGLNRGWKMLPNHHADFNIKNIRIIKDKFLYQLYGLRFPVYRNPNTLQYT